MQCSIEGSDHPSAAHKFWNMRRCGPIVGLTVVVLLGGCVQATYRSAYPEMGPFPRATTNESIDVYHSADEVPRDYYVIGVIQTESGQGTGNDRHIDKVRSVSTEKGGHAAIFFGSQEELTGILNTGALSFGDESVSGYSVSVPVSRKTGGAAVIRYYHRDEEQGVVSAPTRELYETFEIDRNTVEEYYNSESDAYIVTSIDTVGSPAAELEYRKGEDVSLEFCRVVGLMGLQDVMNMYRKRTLDSPERADFEFMCGEFTGRTRLTSDAIEMLIIDASGRTAWKGSFTG